MRMALSIVFVMILLASVVLMAVMPVSASPAGTSEEYMKLFEGDNKITRGEIANAITSYMLGGGSLKLEELRNAAHVYAYWNGKPKTITDSADRTVTIYKPIKRIAMMNGDCMPIMRAIHATDKIVAVNKYTIQDEILYPEFSDYPNIGSVWSPNYEALLAAKPDTVILILYGTIFKKQCTDIENKLKEVAPDVTTIWLDGYKPGLTPRPGAQLIEESRELGYLLDREEEAEKWIGFYEGVMDSISEKVESIENKTKVYLECWHPYYTAAKGTGWHQKLEIAGGENIFGDLTGYVDVDPEEVVRRNPEVIIVNTRKGGYTGSVSELKDLRGDFLDTEDPDYRPVLFNVTAVKNEEVYVITSEIYGGTEHFIGIAYIAKWLYPDLFKDLDPEAIHKQYLTEFQGLENGDSLVDNGVFVYPPLAS